MDKGVAICMDCRHHSMEFARAAAEVCACLLYTSQAQLQNRADMVVSQPIKNSFAFPAELHQLVILQNTQLMAYGALGHTR